MMKYNKSHRQFYIINDYTFNRIVNKLMVMHI